jgi:SagB-type dehydrogenase family enzyme
MYFRTPANNVYTIGQRHEPETLFEVFHENTKYFPASFLEHVPSLVWHLYESRLIRGNCRHYKRFSFAPVIPLPKSQEISASFSEVAQNRVSCRAFGKGTIDLDQLSTLLYLCAGINRVKPVDAVKGEVLRLRLYPSAGALYPIDVYPVLLRVDGLAPCLTYYHPVHHHLSIVRRSIDIEPLMEAIGDLEHCCEQCALVFLFTGVFQRTTAKYGDRGYRFVQMEAGFMAQNLSLAASGLNLGSLMLGGYFDDMVNDWLKVDGVNETVLNCMLIGHTEKNGNNH